MANRPLSTALPADLPEDWSNGQIVAPQGAAVGLSEQHGYNYLSKQINDAQEAINAINEAFDGIVPKPTYVQKTIDANGWQANKTYSFATEYPFANYDLEVSLAEGVTDAQRDAYANAMIVGSIFGNYIQALGEVPTINIPVYLKVTAK